MVLSKKLLFAGLLIVTHQAWSSQTDESAVAERFFKDVTNNGTLELEFEYEKFLTRVPKEDVSTIRSYCNRSEDDEDFKTDIPRRIEYFFSTLVIKNADNAYSQVRNPSVNSVVESGDQIWQLLQLPQSLLYARLIKTESEKLAAILLAHHQKSSV